MALSLLDWSRLSDRQGVWIRCGSPEHHFSSFSLIGQLARRLAEEARDRGMQEHARVGLCARLSEEMLAAVYGTWGAGASVTSLPHPFAFREAKHFDDVVTPLIRELEFNFVLCDAEAYGPMQAVCAAQGYATRVLLIRDLLCGESLGTELSIPEVPLIQCTSGSSGTPRGVRVPRESLEAGLNAIVDYRGWTSATRNASWLPIHHDMGFITTLAIMETSSTGWLCQPEDFLFRPGAFLRTISEHRVDATVMPNFALDYLCRRVASKEVLSLDLTSLETIALGGERVRESTMRNFVDHFAPAGVKWEMLQPAYGGAEVTLCVSGVPVGAGAAVRELRSGRGSEKVVSCGPPVLGAQISIIDDEGIVVADGEIGQIVVSGPMVANGYVNQTDFSASSDGARIYHTGDAGALVDGELYVLGRIGDAVKVRGQRVLAESIEESLSAQSIGFRRCIVLLGHNVEGAPSGHLCLVGSTKEQATLALDAARLHAPDLVWRVLHIDRSDLLMTSSGKPRRREMWRRLVDNSSGEDIS